MVDLFQYIRSDLVVVVMLAIGISDRLLIFDQTKLGLSAFRDKILGTLQLSSCTC